MAANRVVSLLPALIVLKLILAPLAVWLASIASKRYGHVIGGILSGFPMIAAPVTAGLLIDHSASQVASIALATVSGLVATIGFIVAFAWVAAKQQVWWVCLSAATLAFIGLGITLTYIEPPVALSVGVGLCAPWVAQLLLPRVPVPSGAVQIINGELALRLLGAFSLAAVLLFTAGNSPAWLSGLLIAWPITGSILPCFIQRRNGPNATVAFFAGFSRGLGGFAVFFCCLGLALPPMGKTAAYLLAIACAMAVALMSAKAVQRAT